MNNNCLTESLKKNLATAFGNLQRANSINQEALNINQEALDINKTTAERMKKLLNQWYEDSIPCPMIKLVPKSSTNNCSIPKGTVVRFVDNQKVI